MTWLPGVAANMTPPLTSSADSCPLSAPVETIQAGCSRETFAAVICASGL